MAFFKLRRTAGEQPAPAPAPESVDALRKRARYRLAGAAILVLAGVIGFPLLFDNQPRPIAVDIPIDIPDKAKARPLTLAPASEPKALAASAPAEPKAAGTAPVASRAVSGQLDAGVAKAQESKAASKEVQKEEVIISSSKPTDKTSEKSVESVGRFIVQFGAFTDSALAHEARLKVEKAGLKTYSQVAETPEGKKFRVRVGPFDKRSEAEKAAEKIKKIGLPAAILGL